VDFFNGGNGLSTTAPFEEDEEIEEDLVEDLVFLVVAVGTYPVISYLEMPESGFSPLRAPS